MQRVMIIGQPGAGKSTLAILLEERTGLPLFHIDKIHWKPGWVERPAEEKAELIRAVHALDSWIFEGGNSASYAERIARADTVVWLDVPLAIRIWRVTRRAWKARGQTRPDMQENCPERFGWEFMRFLAFIWRTRHSSRAKMQALHDGNLKGVTFVRLRTVQDVHSWLNTLEPSAVLVTAKPDH